MDFFFDHLLVDSAAARVRELLDTFVFNPAAPGEMPTKSFRMPDDHAKTMLDLGIFEEVGHADDLDLSLYNVMLYFCVVEARAAGDRLRPICWPKLLLAISTYVSQHVLKSVDKYRQLARLGGQASTFDLQASFWQVPLPAGSKLVCVTESGKVVRMTRMPYGADAASEIMHILTSALAGDPRYAKPQPKLKYVPASRYDVECATHIDNVFLGGNFADIRREVFLELCQKANAALNVEPGNALSTQQKFVGLHIDLDNATVRLKDGYGSALSCDGLHTYADFERLMGKLLYAGAVLAVNWRDYVFLIKMYRRVLSRCSRFPQLRHEPFYLWPSVERQLRALVDTVKANQPVKVERQIVTQFDDEPDFIIASDATTKSFGGLLLRKGHLPVAFGARFPHEVEINLAETVAVECLIRRFRNDLATPKDQPPRKLLVLVDNTSAMYRVLGADMHGRLDESGVVQSIRELGSKIGFDIRVEYINTKVNPADKVSRLSEPDPVLVDAVMTQAWGQKVVRDQQRARGWRTARCATR